MNDAEEQNVSTKVMLIELGLCYVPLKPGSLGTFTYLFNDRGNNANEALKSMLVRDVPTEVTCQASRLL